MRIPIVRTWLAILALGVAAFTWYGSLVPFQFQERSWGDAVEAYRWVWQNRIWPESRSDALANFMLGVPLGFCLLGALRLDKRSGITTILTGLALIPLCLVFASIVEFSQLWTKQRTCAASDALAQALGAMAGVALWLGFGEWTARYARDIWDSPNIGGRYGRALLVYIVFLGAVETLPWDLTASPSEWVRKTKKVTWEPFEELTNPAKYPTKPLDKSRAWVELIALFAPVGLLAAGLPGSFSRWSGIGIVMISGYGIGLLMELAQWPVESRHPSVTDIIIDGSSVTLGWLVGRAIMSGRLQPVIPVVGWLMLLAVYHWWPMNFDLSVVHSRIQQISLIPFLSLESKQPMMWLEEVTVKMLIVAPIGAAAARQGWVRSVGLSLLVGFFFEYGQLALILHYPSLTDVLLAGMGGFLGCFVARAMANEVVVNLSPQETPHPN